MIEYVNEGEPLKIRAEDWNTIADAANAFAEGSGASANAISRHRGGGEMVSAIAASDLAAGQAVRLTGSKLTTGSDVERSGGIVAEVDPDFSSIVQGAWGITQAPAPAGLPCPVAVAGLCYAHISGWTSGRNYARPANNSGQLLAQIAPGPLAIVSQPAADGFALCCFNNYVPWQNIVPSDATKIYVIDRTDSGDDAKAWNPGANTPGGWDAYLAVKLITQTIRFDGSTLQFVPVAKVWAACNAPVILAATATNIGTSCGA